LEFRTPFELLVAVVLSAQATDRSVNEATRELFRTASTPQKMLGLGEEGLILCIQRIGLYRTKARTLSRLCKILVEQHGGQVPRTREELEALPDGARKTANLVSNL